MSKATSLIKRLNELLPDLEDGRSSHVEWRDATDDRYEVNYDCGDREFHREYVKIYDKRIKTVKDTIKYLEEL